MNTSEFINSPSLLSDRARLAIMASLASAKRPLDFTFLLNQLNLSRGNLSCHIRRLEEAEYVEIKKTFIGRKPNTAYECTGKGKKALQTYLIEIENLLKMSGTSAR